AGDEVRDGRRAHDGSASGGRVDRAVPTGARGRAVRGWRRGDTAVECARTAPEPPGDCSVLYAHRHSTLLINGSSPGRGLSRTTTLARAFSSRRRGPGRPAP